MIHEHAAPRPVPASAVVIAHRGASGYRPEHTRAAYLLAFAQGVDAVEPDLVATRDGVLVIRHENEISGTTDVADHPEFAARRASKTIDGEEVSGWFTEDFTWDELSTLTARERLAELRAASAGSPPEGMLRFVDLLVMLESAPLSSTGDRIGLVVEVKHPTYFASIGVSIAGLLAAELARAGWTDDPRLTIECFELSALLELQRLGVGGRVVFLIEAEGAPADDPTTLYSSYLTSDSLADLAAHVDGISVSKRLLQSADVGSALVSRAHAHGLTVFCWTLRAENLFLPADLRIGSSEGQFGEWRSEFTGLLRLGLDGVFADQPDLAIEARALLAAERAAER